MRNFLLSHPNLNPFNNYFRMFTSPIRLMPDVIIAGFHKTSTTSLHYYLIQHPNIGAPTRKEIGYFSTFFWRGESWYRSHFPTTFSKFFKSLKKQNFIVLDSDPICSFHPLSPQRVKERLPKTKIIFVLRNPIDRAWSDYNQDIRKGHFPDISFQEKIKKDELSFQKRMEQFKNEKMLDGKKHTIYRPYLSISKYIIHINNWLEYFPKNQILFLTTDEIDLDLNKSLNKIFNFLEIPSKNISSIERQNVGKYPKMDPETRQQLIEFFKPYNKKLETLLEKSFHWDN